MAYENNPYIVHETVGSMSAITGKTYSAPSNQSWYEATQGGLKSVPVTGSVVYASQAATPTTTFWNRSASSVVDTVYKSPPDEVLAATPYAQAIFEKQAVYAAGSAAGSAAAIQSTNEKSAPLFDINPMLLIGLGAAFLLLRK